MKIEQGIWNKSSGIKIVKNEDLNDKAQLVLYFGSRDDIIENSIYTSLRQKYPKADIVGCSTSGHILDNELYETGVVFSAIYFEKSKVKISKSSILSTNDSLNAGNELGTELKAPDLAGVLVFSKGLDINGSEFVKGISKTIDGHGKIPVVGGLAGDDDKLELTAVAVNGKVDNNGVVGIGFYGDKIEIKTGADGGWEGFGPQRVITRSKGNILYELDHKPALELYKTYLGEESIKLPYSGLFFPLAIWDADANEDSYLIRTPLDIDEENNSIILAGDVPEGSMAQLMWGKIDSVTEGAGAACKTAAFEPNSELDSLHIVISCVGRKLLMGQRIIGEIEAAHNILKNKCGNIIGFYSYGEIAPHKNSGFMSLHNETMTVGSIREIA